MPYAELSPNDVSDNQNTASKESLLLLCTEDAIRLFSLSHAIQVFIFPVISEVLLLCESMFFIMEISFVQGMKNITNKKKLNGRCCFASLIHSTSSEIGLVLVFSNGKMETR
jgi:hypothetical protein